MKRQNTSGFWRKFEMTRHSLELVRVAAAVHLLNRGTPKQSVEVEQSRATFEDMLRALHEARAAKQSAKRAEGERPATEGE
jgi:hypothetical protein